MALFTAFQTSGSFQTTVLKDQNLGDSLGYQSLAIIYAVFAICNFVAPPIVKVLGPRLSMIFGSAMYALFIATFLKPAQWSILGASALVGVGAAVLWTAQGNFLTINTTEENRGQMSGIFWALLQCSLLIGNLMAYFLINGKSISADTAHQFYEILFGAACGGVVLFFFLRKSRSKKSLSMDSPIEEKSQGLGQQMKDILRLMVTPDMLLISIPIIYSGLELTFWSAKYPTMIGDAFHPRDIGLSGITVGVAEILGGMTMGRVADAYGRSWVMMIALFAHAVGLFLIFFNLISNEIDPSLELALACSFLLGFGDSAVNTALYSELGTRYSTDSANAFALFKFFQSAAAGIGQAYAGDLAVEYQLLILAVVLLLGTYTFTRLSVRSSRDVYQPLISS
eukprot:TRINITY_DN12019_c1_g4_i4.p1 TRINITY_DN12019_c1_g4~~TRINITY_DN12019_c1_g4_i4.p1  ORF type:complete len:430 (+),score=70.69 TRINITY_DN12019_c1_g4_i4:104-1291(+)